MHRAELTAAVNAFRHFSDKPLNMAAYSAYVVGSLQAMETTLITKAMMKFSLAYLDGCKN